jgi:hypothetical protein
MNIQLIFNIDEVFPGESLPPFPIFDGLLPKYKFIFDPGL